MNIDSGHFTFFYPFNYRQSKFKDFTNALKEDGYTFFNINNKELETKFYGEDITICNDTLKQYFYPFIEDKLFNPQSSSFLFNRFSKAFSIEGTLNTEFEKIPFLFESADVFLCPFGIGILVIRTKLLEKHALSCALQFARRFRILEAVVPNEEGDTVTINNQRYKTLQQCIHTYIAPMLEHFYVDYSYLGENASKMPFFEDERMFVSSYIAFDPSIEITNNLLYRCGKLNGYDAHGKPYISSTNPAYIKEYVKSRTYMRWAPHTYLILTMHTTCHLTNKHDTDHLAAFYGTNFYNTILHYFYKMMMLKLSFEHSELQWKKDLAIVEKLIEEITKFASRYYFVEVSVRTEGRELSLLIRQVLRIDEQYRSIKDTLDELYRVQEDRANERQNDLLFILTVFSMISGLFGMNLVVEMLAEPIEIVDILKFTLFEMLAFILTITGVIISIALVLNKGLNFLRNYFRKKNRARKR